jgi:hypothetical protein
MSPTEIILGVGVGVTLLLGLLNFYGSRDLGQAQSIKAFNEAIKLANDRAADAERRAFEAEKRVDELEVLIDKIEKKLTYRLTFDVVLGASPSIEKSEIVHFIDRRIHNVERDYDRRGK